MNELEGFYSLDNIEQMGTDIDFRYIKIPQTIELSDSLEDYINVTDGTDWPSGQYIPFMIEGQVGPDMWSMGIRRNLSPEIGDDIYGDLSISFTYRANGTTLTLEHVSYDAMTGTEEYDMGEWLAKWDDMQYIAYEGNNEGPFIENGDDIIIDTEFKGTILENKFHWGDYNLLNTELYRELKTSEDVPTGVEFNLFKFFTFAKDGTELSDDNITYSSFENTFFYANLGDSPEPEPEPITPVQSTYSDIADAIRAKTGKSAKMTVSQMPSEIESIETGESSTVLRVPFIVSERVYREKFPKLIIDTSKKWLRALSLDNGMEYDFQFGEWVYDSNYKPVMIDGQHVHFDFRENNDSLELALNHSDSQDFSMAQFNFVNTLEDDYITEFGSLEYSGTEDILDFFTITEDNGIYIIEQNENYNIGLNQALEGCYSMHAEEKLVSIEGE